MVARVTQLRIRPGKMEEFVAMIESLTTALDKLDGFRFLVVMRGEDPNRDATAISVWDSAEQMKSSESDQIYYDAIKRIIAYCESFSPMHQHDVLKIKFGKI